MSTIDHTSASDSDRIDVLYNQKQQTVTFVADHDENGTRPPTEWITVPTETTVDLEQHR
jgi:hypothetical protein